MQTVIRRFGSKEGLVRAIAESVREEVETQRGDAPVGDIEGAVANLVEHYERQGDVALHLLHQEDWVPAFAEVTAQGRQFHADWCARVFAPWLAGDGAEGSTHRPGDPRAGTLRLRSGAQAPRRPPRSTAQPAAATGGTGRPGTCNAPADEQGSCDRRPPCPAGHHRPVHQSPVDPVPHLDRLRVPAQRLAGVLLLHRTAQLGTGRRGRKAAVAITHGGMGATQKALSAGVPVVVAPFGRDQAEVGRRAETAGAGIMLTRRRLTPHGVRDAVRRARLLQPAASELASRMNTEGGAPRAVDRLEALTSRAIQP